MHVPSNVCSTSPQGPITDPRPCNSQACLLWRPNTFSGLSQAVLWVHVVALRSSTECQGTR